MDSVKLDKHNNGTDFERHYVSDSGLIGYAEITGYIIFDI